MVFICGTLRGMQLRLGCLLALIPLALSSEACTSGPPAGGGRVPVAAALYPLAWAAERVGGSRVSVSDLTPPGVEPHDLELAPGGVAAVTRAALVVYLGGSFQPAVAAAAAESPARSLDVAPHPGRNLHVWLDPVEMSAVVGRVAAALEAVDPHGAGGYERRAHATERALDRLARSYSSSLRHCARRSIFTSHAAFGALAARFGLTQVAIARDPEAEPLPDHLVAAVKRARAEGTTTVFTERAANPGPAETVAGEIGARTADLDPLESPPPRGGYLTSMRGNLRSLRGALGCR